MTYLPNNRASLVELPSLALAIDTLLNRNEKTWGCFQVKKEADFYSLYIPALFCLKLYKSPKSQNYKGYWRNPNQDTLPDIKDKNDKPDIYLRNKTKQVSDIKKPRLIKKQRVIEIKYLYNSCPEIRYLNQIITNKIRDRIMENISFVPGEEIMPLVLVTEVMDN